MRKNKPKDEISQAGTEYLIRKRITENGETTEYYLKDISRDRIRDPFFDKAFGNPGSQNPYSDLARVKKKAEKKKEERPPATDGVNVTATWTRDETQAKYFHSLKAAEEMIRKWGRHIRDATIIQA